MWYLEIGDRQRRRMRLRLPPEGLLVGESDECDLWLPGVDPPVRFVPFRQGVWIEHRNGETQTLTPGDSFTGDGVVVTCCRLIDEPPSTQPSLPTKTLFFNPETALVEQIETAVEIVEGVDAPRRIELDGDRFVIGKLAGCDIVLTDNYVSGRHARLALTARGWTIADLGSRNGTHLDGARVSEAVWPPDKPLTLGRTMLILRQNRDACELELPAGREYAGMIGVGGAMRRVFALIARLADLDATVLLTGPTGCGKELAARALHYQGKRREGPFVPVNCGAIVRELVAGELFGHVRGAFTGATADRRGVFEMARGGTVLLDEIGELPLELQPALLRVLEERTVRRVGDDRERPVDVRVVAATHRDLAAEVAAGRFRQDLYYRLAMMPIPLPPRAERLDDLAPLAEHLLRRESERQGVPAPTLSPAALDALCAHSWPGNVRELANVLARALILAAGRGRLEPGDLLLDATGLSAPGDGALSLEQAEKKAIERVLAVAPHRREAARLLGIAGSTLYEKLKKYGLDQA